jgi:hypothetical protein
LAQTVGTWGVGIMNSTAFLLLANINPEVDENQEMDLTIGSLNFHVGSLGSIRLLDPAKLDPSASETKTITMSESSVGSSSEVNSPVSFATVENIGEKIKELDETMENLGLGGQPEDFMICYDDALDKSTDTWKIGLELHEDDETIFSSSNSKFDNRYQELAIVGDNSEEFDDNNNLVLNPANINRGANHLAEGDTTESLASREKIRISVEEWNTIKAVVEHGMPIPTDASKNMLLGYHYALQQQSKQLARERSEIQKRTDSAIAASIALHKARNDTSFTNSKRHHRHGSRVENLKNSERRSLSKDLDSSFLSIDEQGNIIPKTPEAALVVAQTYLYTTRPSPGDPREYMHRSLMVRC